MSGPNHDAASISASLIAVRFRRSRERLRFRVGLWLAYVLWTAADALTAVGNWLEDRATASHPLSLRTHWTQRHDALNGWQR